MRVGLRCSGLEKGRKMVLSKIANLFWVVKGRGSGPHASGVRYMLPSGLPPNGGSSAYTSGFTNAGHKNDLRHSSSLQDLPSYHGLVFDDGNLNGTHSKPPHPLWRDNVVSSFSKEKSSPGGSAFPRRKWIRRILVLLCLLLFFLLIYMVSMYAYAYWSQGTSKFYVVLDCGSTGTRVYVYQASLNYKKDGSLPLVIKSFNEGVKKKPQSQSGRAYDRMETEPGFDKLVHNVSGLTAAINPLVRWAKKQIPKQSHKTTSLFLYATAGVRRLPEADSRWLLDNAWPILKTSPFLCKKEWVKIISGVEEAYYGWAALNYRTHMLGFMPKKATFGALDLGGSSLQVTFESKENMRNSSSLKLRIGASDHHLNAYSLSGYGLNDAFDKSVARLVKIPPESKNTDLTHGNVELKHPCLHSGYKERYICSQCASNFKEGGSPVVQRRKLGKGGKPGISLHLIGAPNWEECSALAKVAVNISEWSRLSPGIDCDLQPCALPDNLARPHGHFYAMSGFFVVYRFFNLTADATLDDVLEKGREFCEKTWEVAKNSVAPQPFIEQYCFRAPYIALLLREGLHITDNQITIGSGGITWTLGVALLESGKAFPMRMGLHSYEVLQMRVNPVLLMAILLATLSVLLCALSRVYNWMPRFFRRSYLPLFKHNSASAASVLNVPSPFRFQRWSPINSGDQRVKMPLSPTIGDSQQGPFGFGHGLGGSGIQLTESSLYPSTSSVSHSFSSSSLGQMQYDSSGMSPFWSSGRSQMRLQSRRSQSREDLNSSLAEAHMAKV